MNLYFWKDEVVIDYINSKWSARIARLIVLRGTMSFLFAQDRHWSVANWVSRGFFADATTYLEETPSIADDIKFCIETDTDTIDLRNADQVALNQLLILVDRVVAANRRAGPSSFHSPEAFPAYLQLLQQLRNTVASLIVQAS